MLSPSIFHSLSCQMDADTLERILEQLLASVYSATSCMRLVRREVESRRDNVAAVCDPGWLLA